MLPGVWKISSSVPGSIAYTNVICIGDKVCVKVLGNPCAFAVGDALMDVDQATLASSEKKKGRAMVPLHIFGDLLSDNVVPNAGFDDGQWIKPVENITGSDGD